MNQIVDALLGIGATLGVAAVVGAVLVVYVAFWPEKAERVGGWIGALFSRWSRRAAQTKMKFSVQADINQARLDLLEDAPPDLLTRSIRVDFADTDEAMARLENGEVLVTLRQAHHGDNVVAALMAYLPKALIPEAREFVDRERMEAIYLIVAKAMLMNRRGDEVDVEGALDVLTEQRLAPARSSTEEMSKKILESDETDLQGWLSRVLLWEYRKVGEEMKGGVADAAFLRETDELARWLAGHAKRTPGEEAQSLNFRWPHIKVALIFVAIAGRLQDEGIRPYRQRAKRLIYQDRFDAVYLMARDGNIEAVEAVCNSLASDGLIHEEGRYVYELRRDFRRRTGLDRKRAIVACLRRRDGGSDPGPGDETADSPELPEETHEPPRTRRPAPNGSPARDRPREREPVRS